MTPLRWHPDTKEEITEAAAWYAAKREGLGAAFVDAVQAAAHAISVNPLRFSPLGHAPPDAQPRRALVSGFPYLVIYEVRTDHVLIVAVAHERRRPGYWARRRV
ncbi:MAG: type II toxin-antitoxin system RelE/ParE family toxin [Deltaproteobacteria bacterium]|nr:type II toxin-antitoxin system RelE/ParE family toxin [Deltaproteobacteria bacterium]